VEALRDWSLFRVLSREFPAANQSGSFARMENELYKEFYAGLISLAQSGFKGGSLFLDYILLDIDLTNIRNLFRFRSDEFAEDARESMIPGGSFSTRVYPIRVFNGC